MKISDEAVEAACREMTRPNIWGDSDSYALRMRRSIYAALNHDGYPKLLAEALSVMRETGWPNAIDHATSVDGIIELAAHEVYSEFIKRE